jgi:hypothetical protein
MTEKTSNLVMTYKARSIVLLTEAEIINNTFDGLVYTGFLNERIDKAIAELGVFEDLYRSEN